MNLAVRCFASALHSPVSLNEKAAVRIQEASSSLWAVHGALFLVSCAHSMQCPGTKHLRRPECNAFCPDLQVMCWHSRPPFRFVHCSNGACFLFAANRAKSPGRCGTTLPLCRDHLAHCLSDLEHNQQPHDHCQCHIYTHAIHHRHTYGHPRLCLAAGLTPAGS